MGGVCSHHCAMLAPHNDVCHLKPFVVQDVGYLIKKKKGTGNASVPSSFQYRYNLPRLQRVSITVTITSNFRESTIKCVA